ncbi:MAG: glycoside hydrolase family 2 protein [Siculibacillus sp.]|nr:glycoside hydrolase family 2 protein [Siculibacillus sp.]
MPIRLIETVTHALSISASRRPLETGWRMTSTAPGAWASPADVDPAAEWLDAVVPGTVAAALEAAGRWSREAPSPLHDRDHWYRTTVAVAGRRRLRFDGLATFAEVFLDGAPILTSRSMFLSHEVDVDLRPGMELAIVFRSLSRALDGVKPKRARWRPRLIPEQRLRAVRTTLLGHMPGWCPPIDMIGPFRPITIFDPATDPIRDVRLDAGYDGIDGHLAARLVFEAAHVPASARLLCAGCETTLTPGPDGAFVGEVALAGIAPWWPATHGDPVLHAVEVEIDGVHFALGRVGFRRIEVDRGEDGRGFGLVVNGVPIFARGSVWVPIDLVGLAGDRAAHEAELTRMRDAGLNMVRVPGIGLYEAEAFHDLCDELGLLVWQDLMFANFDYPAADPDFVAAARAETHEVAARLARHPSSAIVCGGSEITQQAAMMGLPPTAWSNAIFDEILPAVAAETAPGLPWVRSTPDGGEMPFVADAGVTHYYGVGAYGRPLDDARRANVRFAAECLAFACIPEARTVTDELAVPPVHSPRWKAGVPRDLGAGWDFEDVREIYERMIFRIDPPALRHEDPERLLDVGRATVDHVIEETVREWRRPGSTCRGALVFTHRDPKIGAGWGLVDALGRAKSAFHALARASAPVVVILSDEGVNGLDVHVVNDTAAAVAGRLDLVALADGHRSAASGTREVAVPPHGSVSLAATEIFGGFFDTTRAYRFGPAAHDLTHARLVADDGTVIAEAFHHPLGRSAVRRRCGLTARVERVGADWELVIACEEAVSSVMVIDESFTATDGFHMAPGEKRVRLHRRPEAAAEATPEGSVRALDARERPTYRA